VHGGSDEAGGERGRVLTARPEREALEGGEGRVLKVRQRERHLTQVERSEGWRQMGEGVKDGRIRPQL